MKHWFITKVRPTITGAPGGKERRRGEPVRRRARVATPSRRPIWVAVLAGVSAPTLAMLLAAGPAQPGDGPVGVVESAAVEAEGDDTVARAWRERFMERERAERIGGFASEFSIPETLAEQIYRAAQRHEIEPAVAFGLVRAESSFRRTVVSHAGAVGYTQLLPSTARWIAPGTTRASLFNTETNLDVGFRYLRYLKDKYDGNVDLALTAYNRGQGRVDRDLRAGRNPDNGYATAVRTGHVSRTLARQNSPRG